MNTNSAKRSQRQPKTALVQFFPSYVPPGVDTYTSQDGRIRATVGSREARIYYPVGGPSVLIRLKNAVTADGFEAPCPVFSDGFVDAHLSSGKRHGNTFVLPGITLYED